MANNKDKGIVPYHDPYDSLLQSIVNFGNDPNPTLADVWQYGGLSTNSSSLPQQNNVNGDENGNRNGHGNRNGSNGTLYNNDPFSDPMIQDMGNFSIDRGENFEAGPSELHGKNSHPYPNDPYRTLYANDPFSDPMVQDMGTSSINKGGNSEAGPSEPHGRNSHPYPNGPSNSSGQMPPSLWPDPPVPVFCSSCLVLREIIHTNGVNIVKLEVHGRVGVIHHAIQIQSINVGTSDNEYKFQKFDFSDKSFEEIKTFLTKYGLEQASSGYISMQEPLSAYYEALCVGLDWTHFNHDLYHNSGAQSEEMEQAGAEAEDEMERLPRTSLSNIASQRERAGRMKLMDFSDYFHLPIEEAAKRVNLCPTVVKKICRKEGLGRWPHRKVKSIVRQISILRKRLEIEDESSRVGTQAEIDRLYQEMVQHCGGVFPTSISFE